jgi:hypothetical protein
MAAPEASSPEPLNSLQRSLTGGSALPPSLRQRMESGFGSSFGDVRVHTGGAAAAASARLQAEAFTSGRDIAFATGQYRPGTPAGDRLIAHELAHVVQQRHGGSGGAVQRHTNVSQASEAAEMAADTAAATVLAGGRLRPSAGGLSLRGRIQRRARLGAPAPSPVLTLAPPQPGATAPGAGPVLTPATTASVSPAGGRLSGINRPAGPGAPEATATSPDTAQTAAPAVPATGRTPATVMVAGAPAGSAAPSAAGGEPRRKRQRQRSRDQRQPEALPVARGGGPGRRVGGAGGGGGGRFGRNLGDRGEAAAEAARQRLSARAQALETNEGADTRIGAARAAAEPPANAAEADGQRSQTSSLAAAEIPAPDSAAASRRAQASLQAAAPTTIEELDNFAGPGGAGSRAAIGNAIAAEADQQAGPVRQTMGAIGSAPAGAAPPPAVPQPEPLAAPASADPALAAATPPPVPGESLDASEFRDAADGALAEHDIDDATLERAEEGPLHAIGAGKRELNEAVDTAAGRARTQEASAIGSAESALSSAETQAEGAMEGGREAAQTAVTAEQDATRGGEQTGEQTLADSITGIYSRAETSVSERLGSLQSDAVERFRSAQAERLEQFTSGVRSDLDAFKRQRYAGAEGLYYQARDWLLSINSVPAVQALYERHRSAYIAAIDQLMATIRTDIEATIADCRRTLAAARTEIDALVQSRRSSLDAEAQAALNRATAQFAAMESRIDSTRRTALAALDAERTRAITEMDRALEEIRAENAGLVDRIASAIAAIAAALGEFMALLARVTRMGVGAFLSAALGQARDGVQNHLWDQLQEAFKQWIFMKLPVLQLLLNLPPNWLAMLTALSLSLIGLFTDSLPAMLPLIGAAAMVWLATTLVAKLIPGVGAIMAVIDAIRGAWSLVQSLFSAAGAFLQFVMKVAEPAAGAGMAFARALAYGIVGAVDAILTFLGVDRLIRRVVGAIARPFGRIIQRIQTRFSQWQQRRRQRRSQARARDRRRDGGRENPADANRHRRAEDAARQDRRAELDRRRRDTERDSRRPERRRESDSDRRRRREAEQSREREERKQRAVAHVRQNGPAAIRGRISAVAFRARLAIWRVRFRVQRLSLDRRGQDGFTVTVQNSAPVNAMQAFTPQQQYLLRRIRQLVDQHLAANTVPGAQSAIRRSGGATPARPRDPGAAGGNPNTNYVQTIRTDPNLEGRNIIYHSAGFDTRGRPLPYARDEFFGHTRGRLRAVDRTGSLVPIGSYERYGQMMQNDIGDRGAGNLLELARTGRMPRGASRSIFTPGASAATSMSRALSRDQQLMVGAGLGIMREETVRASSSAVTIPSRLVGVQQGTIPNIGDAFGRSSNNSTDWRHSQTGIPTWTAGSVATDRRITRDLGLPLAQRPPMLAAPAVMRPAAASLGSTAQAEAQARMELQSIDSNAQVARQIHARLMALGLPLLASSQGDPVLDQIIMAEIRGFL